jgi:hypothetical protein
MAKEKVVEDLCFVWRRTFTGAAIEQRKTRAGDTVRDYARD